MTIDIPATHLNLTQSNFWWAGISTYIIVGVIVAKLVKRFAPNMIDTGNDKDSTGVAPFWCVLLWPIVLGMGLLFLFCTALNKIV